MQPTDLTRLPKYIFTGKKFIRREDLTESIRSYIAVKGFLAGQESQRGVITHLSRQFNVSRQFIYDTISGLKGALSLLFGKAPSKIKSFDEKAALSRILSLRLEGKCSIEAISTYMKRFSIPYNSAGYISKQLKRIGSLLPDTLINKDGNVRLAVFASDEIFSNRTPILVTVEPVSSAILRMELADARKAENWVNHWNCIERNGHTAIYLVSDEGTGLKSGHSEYFPDEVFHQPDTFHAVSHKLGIWADRFEKSAYRAMEEEYKRLNTIDSAKSEKVLSKRIKAYEAAVKETYKNIELYEQFKYIYTGIVGEMRLFDFNGNLRERKRAEVNIMIYLDLIDSLNNKKLSDIICKIRGLTPGLTRYFNRASTIARDLKKFIPGEDEDAFKALCAGWQQHKMYIKSKNAASRNYYRENEVFCLEIAEGYLQERYESIKERIYHGLNHIVQSSAMAECINSIIRPYLNTSRNQISREMLNLIMFYHNHRRYSSGERAHKTPYEILSGKKQEKDWPELLFENINTEVAANGKKSLFPDASATYNKKYQEMMCDGSSDDYILRIKLSQ